MPSRQSEAERDETLKAIMDYLNSFCLCYADSDPFIYQKVGDAHVQLIPVERRLREKEATR